MISSWNWKLPLSSQAIANPEAMFTNQMEVCTVHKAEAGDTNLTHLIWLGDHAHKPLHLMYKTIFPSANGAHPALWVLNQLKNPILYDTIQLSENWIQGIRDSPLSQYPIHYTGDQRETHFLLSFYSLLLSKCR